MGLQFGCAYPVGRLIQLPAYWGAIGLLIGHSVGIDRSVDWSADGVSIRQSERAVLLPQSSGRACTASISALFWGAVHLSTVYQKCVFGTLFLHVFQLKDL